MEGDTNKQVATPHLHGQFPEHPLGRPPIAMHLNDTPDCRLISLEATMVKKY